ncbi:PREDICTED: tryptophan aminotransferase-related protein 2-like [Nelumbo nucifera]|uniref:Tryptophan aminotransferase-related protein 2-like n=1 Tax=Nelumbo nucifera TaxID=4432 RepID=A0A1U8Q9N1_NELNU|nr:PREDICTED: tryptophan aminotransferase-related protein 2-like [Nelumbo nucifera]
MPGIEQEVRINGHSSPSYAAFQAKKNGMTKKLPSDSVINLDHGDPKMFELYWQKMGDKCTVVISVWQSLSYFSDITNLCWFLQPELAEEIRRLHHLVASTETEGRYIVVGTGSTQLFQAVLYALSSPDSTESINIISTVPYYSSYPTVTDLLNFGFYKWAGDAYMYKGDLPYIELVTSPNNPDGFIREMMVNRSGGKLIHDLAYYWPQYTLITTPTDHDLMLFTISKSTGHAGPPSPKALVMLGHRQIMISKISFMISCYSQDHV